MLIWLIMQALSRNNNIGLNLLLEHPWYSIICSETRLVSNLLACSRARHSYVFVCLRAWHASVLACLCVWCVCVLMCLTCLIHRRIWFSKIKFESNQNFFILCHESVIQIRIRIWKTVKRFNNENAVCKRETKWWRTVSGELNYSTKIF